VTNNKLIIKTQSQLTPSTEAFELLKRIHWAILPAWTWALLANLHTFQIDLHQLKFTNLHQYFLHYITVHSPQSNLMTKWYRKIPWPWRFWYRENLVCGIPWYRENRPSLQPLQLSRVLRMRIANYVIRRQ